LSRIPYDLSSKNQKQPATAHHFTNQLTRLTSYHIIRKNTYSSSLQISNPPKRMKVYTYKSCSTCRKATKWLGEQACEFDELPIRDTPPTKSELKRMLKAYNGDIKRLFNTSGQDYRKLGMKDKLPGMSADDAIELLSSNGNLVKRPFLLSDQGDRVGFKEEAWQTLVD